MKCVGATQLFVDLIAMWESGGKGGKGGKGGGGPLLGLNRYATLYFHSSLLTKKAVMIHQHLEIRLTTICSDIFLL